jgi:uncharacterized protein YndB with AHSA1/START domain
MPTITRERVLPSTQDSVWSVVADPHHLPRWWPRAQRVESVEPHRWTLVLGTKKGKGVRADFELVESDPPRFRAWAQELEDSPFERLLREASIEVELEDIGGGSTRVRLTQRQKMRGMSRFGGFLARGAGKRILEEALDGLQRCAR